MDIALNRQEQIITYQGKAYNMIGRGLLIATATEFVGTLFYSPITFNKGQPWRFRSDLLHAKG
jgi:hypothetical protein